MDCRRAKRAMSVTLASSDSLISVGIDANRYRLREAQPREGAIYDPLNKSDPIVWLFNPPHQVRMFKDEMLFIRQFEGYSDRKVVIRLIMAGVLEKDVQIIVKNMKAKIVMDDLTQQQLDILVVYITACLKITLQND